MRYLKFILIPTEEGIHPVDQRVAEHPDLHREVIHNLNLLDDGTAVTLYQLRGDIDSAEELVRESPEVLAYNVSQTKDSIHAYVHFESTEELRRLLQIPQEHEIILDFPLEYTPRGGIRAGVIGEEETIRRTMQEVPDTYRLKLERLTEYEPDTDRLFSQLTARQQETLKAAIDAGYYEVPRQATYKDVAREMNRTDGTVGEHLRKIESKILKAIRP